jgi:hypothetical protein
MSLYDGFSAKRVVRVGDSPTRLESTVRPCPPTAFLGLRRMVSTDDWDSIRRASYRLAGYSCQVCGGRGDDWPVAAKVLWEYDSSTSDEHGYGVQRLEGVASLCPTCLDALSRVDDYLRYGIGRGVDEAVGLLAEAAGRDFEDLAREVEALEDETLRLAELPWAVDLSPLEGMPGYCRVPEVTDVSVTVWHGDGIVTGGV